MTDTCRTVVLAERAALLPNDGEVLVYWSQMQRADRKLFSGLADFMACVAHYRGRA